MSSFIPMVSSSPPPMEDDKTFEWEEDGDFGTFTGANDSVTKETDSETNTNWSSTIPVSLEDSPSKDVEFADFKTFNDNIQGSKPSVANLPLVSNIILDGKMSPSTDTNKMSESVESLDLNERNSTQIAMKRDSDSGMFSSDLSPIPVSKETSVVSENCDNNYPESIKLNDSSPETPDEMTISEHVSTEIPSDTDLPVSFKNEVIDNDMTDTKKVENLVDSDEEFDDYSSNVLQTLSSNAAQSSLNPPIKTHNKLAECENSVINKEPSPEPLSIKPLSSDEDEFGDFAEFSSNVLQDQSQTTSKLEPAEITSAITETESDQSFCKTDLSNEPENIDQIENAKVCSDEPEIDSVENLDTLQKELQDGSNSKTVDAPSETDVLKMPENDSHSIDLSEDEYANFSSEDLKTANVVYVDGSSSEGHNDNIESLTNSAEDLNQTDLKSENNASEKIPNHLRTANSADNKHNVLNTGINDNNDCFHTANNGVTENNTENQGKSDSDDDFADFSCAAVKSEENKENFADFSSAKCEIENSSISSFQNDNDDFADFSSAQKTQDENQRDDDFAAFSGDKFQSDMGTVSPSQNDNDDNDFADFSSAKSDKNSANNTATQKSAEQSQSNDDDDFADFTSASHSENFANFNSNKVKDDWGNFSDEDDDDFGNFNKATVINDTPKLAASNISQTPGIEKINTLLETCFTRQIQKDVDVKDCDIIMLDSLLQGSLYTQITKPLTRQDIIKKVLKHIQDYDNTNALMYSWKKSHSNDRLFKTLRIDTQNMLFGLNLKKQAVPLSLTGLTLLEPIRGQQDFSKKDRVLANLVEPTTDSIPQLQEMPPVEFDWHNSGLTNPLEAKTLDLDFMVLQENENSTKTRVFQSELLDAPRSSVKPMQPLEDILKNMKSTTMSTPVSETPQNENLSKEADNVVKSLPLLSFMKSKVLMFKLNS